ncbi:MAG: hypothetical protein RhofKO_31800 [Rhodothermales bacterium]
MNRIVVIVMSCIIAVPAFAQDTESTRDSFDRVNRVARYLTFDDIEIGAYTDERTGVPSWVIDVDSLDLFAGGGKVEISDQNIAMVATRFVEFYAGLLNVNVSTLNTPVINATDNFWHVRFAQQFNGLTIIGSEVGLSVDSDGRIVSFGARAFPYVDVNTEALVPSAVAVQHARTAAGIRSTVLLEAAELKVFPVSKADRFDFALVWSLDLSSAENDHTHNTRFLVDARTGEVVRQHEELHSHRQSDSSPVVQSSAQRSPLWLAGYYPGQPRSLISAVSDQGTNSVLGTVTLNYYETPNNSNNQLIRKTGQPFSGARVDIKDNNTGVTQTTHADANGDYSFSGLNSGSHTVTFFIENERARIYTGVGTSKKQKSFTLSVTGATQKDYNWGWGDDGDADQSTTAMGLNTVYQVNIQYEYMNDNFSFTGMSTLPKRRINIETSANGKTNPWANQMTLGRHFALSSEITHHEYMHDYIYELNGDDMISHNCGSGCVWNEAQAMDEAFADYFVMSRTGNDLVGGPTFHANDPSFPSGQGVTARHLYNFCTMADFNDASSGCGGAGEVHKRSKIISGAAYRIRTGVGSDTDELVFEALQIAPRPQTFANFALRMYTADQSINASSNWSDIEDRFVERSILPPLAPTSLTAYTGSGTGDVDLSWNDVSFTEQGYDIQRRPAGGSWATVTTLAANVISHTDVNILCKAGNNDYEYRIRVYKGTLEDFSPIRAYNPCPINPRVADSGQGIGQVPQRELTANRDPEYPTSTSLDSAYPNPFNPQTVIRYSLSSTTNVKLVVYDILGRVVDILVDENLKAGEYQVIFNAEGLPNGSYVYQLQTSDAIFSKVMTLLK